MRLPSRSAAFSVFVCLAFAVVNILAEEDYDLVALVIVVAIGTLITDYSDRREK